MRSLQVLTGLILGVVAGGCTSSGECETGTVRHGDTCFVTDPGDTIPPTVTVDPPVRTRQVGNVRLTTNKPATIYYTSDGTTPSTSSPNELDQVLIPDLPDDAIVSFFAVDLNGNRSQVQTVAWQIDRTGPGSPRSFQLVVSSTTRTMTWVPPADVHLGGVIVARVEGQLGGSPESGQKYAVGDAIGTGVTAVAVVPAGAAPTFTETHTSTPGIVRYVAWAYDDLLNYGSPAGDYALDTLAAQTGTVSVDTATNMVTVTAQAPNVTFGGTATFNSGTVTLTLNITNATSRVLFAPKVLLGTVPATGTFSNSDGTFDSSPYRAYGAAIAPGGTASATWTFTGVTSGDVLDLGLDVRNNPVLVGGSWSNSSGQSAGTAVDDATFQSVKALAPGVAGSSGRAGMRVGDVTPDGRVIMGSRNGGQLASFDLVTGKPTLGAHLLTEKATVAGVALDKSGSTGYALVAYGHGYSGHTAGIQSFLVRFDAGTLKESGRLDIGQSRNRDLRISPDGKLLAVSTGLTAQGVILIDLDTFSIARSIVPGYRPTGVTFTPDGASVVIIGLGELHVFSLSTGEDTSAILIPTSGKSFEGELGGDGRLWVGRRDDLLAVDLTTGAVQSYAFSAGTMSVFDGKAYVGSVRTTQMQRIDNTGVSEATYHFTASTYGHHIGRSPF